MIQIGNKCSILSNLTRIFRYIKTTVVYSSLFATLLQFFLFEGNLSDVDSGELIDELKYFEYFLNF